MGKLWARGAACCRPGDSINVQSDAAAGKAKFVVASPDSLRSRLRNCRWPTGSANGSCYYFFLLMLQPTREEEEEDVLCKCTEKTLVSLKRKRAIERTAVSARCPRLTDTHGYKWNNTILVVCLFVCFPVCWRDTVINLQKISPELCRLLLPEPFLLPVIGLCSHIQPLITLHRKCRTSN